MTAKAKSTPPDEPLKDAGGRAIDPDKGGVTPPDPDAPTTLDVDVPQSAPSPLDASTLAVEDKTSVTMADVAALHGIGLAPDRSEVRVVAVGDEDAPFISAGMASDLEQQGWALDPATGRKVVRERDGK